MPLGTDGDGRDDNEGPHCRNCHTGANECFTCHTNDDRFQPAAFAGGVATRVDVSSAFTANTAGEAHNRSNWVPQSSYRSTAVAGGLGAACLSGGFTFPHRTLGKDMLKDELFGVNFDGTPIAAGVARTTNALTLAAGTGNTPFTGNAPHSADAMQVYATGDYYNYVESRVSQSNIPAVRNDNGALAGQAAENLDSVCIDCHGDSTYWNGNNSAFLKATGTSTQAYGAIGAGQYGGWELVLKGLP